MLCAVTTWSMWHDHPSHLQNLHSYPLVMADIAMVKPWPIEIDGLPNLEMVGFSMAMLVIT